MIPYYRQTAHSKMVTYFESQHCEMHCLIINRSFKGSQSINDIAQVLNICLGVGCLNMYVVM